MPLLKIHYAKNVVHYPIGVVRRPRAAKTVQNATKSLIDVLLRPVLPLQFHVEGPIKHVVNLNHLHPSHHATSGSLNASM